MNPKSKETNLPSRSTHAQRPDAAAVILLCLLLVSPPSLLGGYMICDGAYLDPGGNQAASLAQGPTNSVEWTYVDAVDFTLHPAGPQGDTNAFPGGENTFLQDEYGVVRLPWVTQTTDNPLDWRYRNTGPGVPAAGGNAFQGRAYTPEVYTVLDGLIPGEVYTIKLYGVWTTKNVTWGLSYSLDGGSHWGRSVSSLTIDSAKNFGMGQGWVDADDNPVEVDWGTTPDTRGNVLIGSLVADASGTITVGVRADPPDPTHPDERGVYDGLTYKRGGEGQTWVQTSAPEAEWSAAASSADGTRLVAAVLNGPIYKSVDAGRTWTPTSAPTNQAWSTVASSADGSTLVAAAFPGPVYVSRDSGTTWTQSSVPATYYWAWVACSADGTRIAAVPYYDGVTASASIASVSEEGDGGTADSVSDTSTVTASDGSYEVAGVSISDGIILPPGFELPPLSAPPIPKPIYLSSDAGTTWTTVEPLGYRIPSSRVFFWTSVAVSVDGSKLAVTGVEYDSFQPSLGWFGHVYTSANAGSTWLGSLTNSYPWNWVTMSGDGMDMLIAGGIVGSSIDGGASWYVSNPAPGVWGAVAISADGSRFAASEYPSDVYSARIAGSIDSRFTWSLDMAPLEQWSGIAMSADGNLSVGVVYGGGVWVSRIRPVILTQPADLHLNAGETAQFSVVAESSIGPDYQWLFNANPLPGQTNDTLILANVQPGDAGLYSVIVSNAVESVISSSALLTVNQYPIADASATLALIISPNNTNATAALDGSLSSDPDGDVLSYRWFDAANTLLGTGVVAVTTLPVGTNLIDLVVDDGMAKDTNVITVEIITPGQAAGKLLEAVADADAGHGQSLIASLSVTLASIDRSNPIAAINQLQAFQNQVIAEVYPIDADSAAQFVQQAQEIIDILAQGQIGAENLRALAHQDTGNVGLEFSGSAGAIYIIEASEDLRHWQMIGIARHEGDGEFNFDDPDTDRFPRRFYRVVTP